MEWLSTWSSVIYFPSNLWFSIKSEAKEVFYGVNTIEVPMHKITTKWKCRAPENTMNVLELCACLRRSHPRTGKMKAYKAKFQLTVLLLSLSNILLNLSWGRDAQLITYILFWSSPTPGTHLAQWWGHSYSRRLSQHTGTGGLPQLK